MSLVQDEQRSYQTFGQQETQGSSNATTKSKARERTESHEGQYIEAANGRQQDELDQLGRRRPDVFKSTLVEAGFVFALVMSQVLTEYFVSGFTVIIPTLVVDLDIPSASTVWPTGAFSLVVASTLLVFGRLSDMYGGRVVYIGGITWFLVWSLIAGFSRSFIMLVLSRALQGLGAAAFLPSSLMILGSVYRPGPRKNLVFGIYAAAAPLGFYFGIFFAGIAGQYTTWGWYFWIGAILAAITDIVAILSLPSDFHERKRLGIKMDWSGAVLIVSGSILVVYAITDSAHAADGWASPHIWATFLGGCIVLCLAVYVEGWYSAVPLIPGDIFHPKYMKPLVLSLFFFYGTLGIIFLYFTLYMAEIMRAGPMVLVAYWTPCAVGGIILGSVGGLFLHKISGTILAFVAGIAWIVAPLLFAVAPGPRTNYWAFIFPAMICTTVGIDIMFNVTNVFITTSMPARRQGLAGSLINVILQGGIAFFLGFADLLVVRTGGTSPGASGSNASSTNLEPYRNAMWLSVACAGASFVIMMGFVRISKAESSLTADELEEQSGEH